MTAKVTSAALSLAAALLGQRGGRVAASRLTTSQRALRARAGAKARIRISTAAERTQVAMRAARARWAKR